MQFSLEKRLEKRKWIHHTLCPLIVPVDGLRCKMVYPINS